METTTVLSSRSLQFYAITRKWLSDIEFYRTEVSFLQKLLDERFFTSPAADERKKIAQLNSELMIFEVEKNQLESSLTQQQKYLELMIEDIIPEDVSWLAGKQIELEKSVSEVFTEYKAVKERIFRALQKNHGVSEVAGRPLFAN